MAETLRKIENVKTLHRTSQPYNIILAPIYNFFVEGTTYDANLAQSSYKYIWYKLDKYFSHQLQQKELPFHFWVEFVDRDYQITMAAPFTHRSHFLETLSNNGCISYMNRNDILIAFDQDVRLEPIDKRMAKVMSYHVIVPMMKTFHLTINNVLFFDDILMPDFDKKISQEKNLLKRYKLEKAKYYDHFILKNILKDYVT